MKKLLLITVTILLSSMLFTQTPIERLNDWTKQQTDEFNSSDVVNFLNGERDAGDITYGSEYVFNSVGTSYTVSVSLDASHFVVAYSDGNNGKAIIGTVTGNAISYGSEYVFNSNATGFLSISSLDATHFVIAYRQLTSGFAIVGTVSGSAITYGTATSISSFTDYISVSSLDATHFVLAFTDNLNNYYGTAIVGTVSGNNISLGSEYVLNNAVSYDISISSLDVNNFVVVYQDASSGGVGTAIIGTVSGSTITYGSEFVFNNSSTGLLSVTCLDASHFVAAYKDGSSGNSIVGAVSGNSIAFGTESTFATIAFRSINISALDYTHFVVTYMDDINYYGKARTGTVSGNVISYTSSESTFNSASTYYPNLAILNANKFVVTYRDDGNNNYGTAIVGSVEATASPSTVDQITFGTGVQFKTGYFPKLAIVELDATHFVVVAADGNDSYSLSAFVGTISGNAITYGAETILSSSSNGSGMALTKLDATHFVIAYGLSGTNVGKAVVGTVSGTVISVGSEYTFNSAETYSISISSLDATKFVVAFLDGGNSNYGTAMVGTVSGNTITYGSEYTFTMQNYNDVSVVSLDANRFVIGYRDRQNNRYGTAKIGDVSGSVITFGSAYVFNSGMTDYVKASKLDSDHFVVGYRDISNSNYSTTVIGTLSGNTISFGTEYVYSELNLYGSWSISGLGANRFEISFRDQVNGVGTGTSIIGTVLGSDIFYGDKYVYYSAFYYQISTARINTNRFVVTYLTDSGAECIIGDIDNTNQIIWDGSSSSDWSTAANWSEDVVPTSNANIYIADVVNDPVVPVNVEADCKTLTIETGGSLTILSDVTGTGSLIIDSIANGNISMERHVTSGAWHGISAPVSGQTANALYLNGNPDVWLKEYDETTNTYSNITSLTTPFNSMDGWMLWVGGSSPQTFTYTGAPNTGTIGSTDNVQRSAAGTDYGYNYVGNPFTSAIDWDASSGWTKTNMENAIYVYNNGNWASYVAGVGTNSGTRYIAAGQGFFVQVSDGGGGYPENGTLKMTNEICIHNTVGFLKGSSVDNDQLIRLELEDGGLTDETVIRFLTNSTEGWDSELDAYKMFSYNEEYPQIFSTENFFMSINSLPENVDRIPIDIKGKLGNMMTISLSEVIGFTNVLLLDKQTGINTDLTAGDYTFIHDGTTTNRFIIYFSVVGITDQSFEPHSIYSYKDIISVIIPKGQNAEIAVYSIAGQIVVKTMGYAGLNRLLIPKQGYYIVQIKSSTSLITKKVFIE